MIFTRLSTAVDKVSVADFRARLLPISLLIIYISQTLRDPPDASLFTFVVRRSRSLYIDVSDPRRNVLLLIVIDCAPVSIAEIAVSRSSNCAANVLTAMIRILLNVS